MTEKGLRPLSWEEIFLYAALGVFLALLAVVLVSGCNP